MRTKQEIDQEIQTLEELKPRVRHYSAFGDNNHAAIDLQIKVLKGKVTEHQLWDMYDDDQMYQRESGLDALAWMKGKQDVSPSENW